MKTKVSNSFFFNGDEITEKPQEGTKCYRCGQDIGHDNKSSKIASLFLKNEDLTIRWNWFCETCFKEITKQLQKDKKKTCN